MPTLEFKGKPFVYSHHLSVPFRELKIDAVKSLPGPSGPGLDDNLIIHGDNLEALKALLPRYAGKVDVIYIDPPYNTGNEGWAYNDNVNAPALKEWLGKVVDAEDMERHDKWLSMMWPRLQLLKELLSDRGSLWVTLDDKEVHRGRLILDEIFSDGEFISQVTWRSSDNSNNDSKGFSADKNHILVYARRSGWMPNKLDAPEKRGHFKNPNGDPRGPWFDGNPVDSPNPRENLKYELTTPSGKTIKHPRNGWRWDESVLLAKIDEGEIRFSEDESRIIRRTYLEDMRGLPPSDLWIDLARYGHNRNAKYELQEMFGGISPFATPKPTKLIRAVLEVASSKDALVLDSFAGSGSTGHAVLALNRADGGDRKCILVQLQEDINENDPAFSLGFRTIIDVTTERIRRAIRGVPTAKDEALKAGLGGTFTYCDLGEPMDLERLFAGGEQAPAWSRVAEYVAYTATGATLAANEPGPDWLAGEVAGYRLHLIYKPDASWMQSNEAMLGLDAAERIAKAAAGKPVLVFAAGKFMAQKALTALGVTFCQLPYSIHRILGDGNEGVAGVDAA